MIILWSYLIKNYIKVFLLTTLAFIGVLIVMRLNEIAQLAASGSPFIYLLEFILVLIPYILPLTFPISSLLSSLLSAQKLSHSGELTALRASGISLKKIISPILFTSFLLGGFNFILASEISPKCRQKTKELILKMTTHNPLFILKKTNESKDSNFFFDLKTLRQNQGEEVLIVSKNKSNNRLILLSAKVLRLKENILEGFNVSVISTTDSKDSHFFDHLIIENQENISLKASELSHNIHKGPLTAGLEYLSSKMIFAKKKVENIPFGHLDVEFYRRISISLAVFSLSLIGLSSGLEFGRIKQKKKLTSCILITLFYMVCFLGAKSIKNLPILSSFIYFVPHLLIVFFALKQISNFSKGSS